MSQISELYRHSLALLTDLYQLTMACAHWHAGTAEREAVYHLVARKAPFGGNAIVCCGTEAVADYIAHFAFTDDDLDWLATLQDPAGGQLLPDAFLDSLRGLRLSVDVDAPPEGSVVGAQTPLLRVRGPVMQVQLLESVLLNLMGFPSLVATKAARLAHAAGDAPVVDFGLRKAHGIDGSITAARAAYVGGCAATAHVLAGKRFGIPVRGTHAHGWVMAFDDELEAFERYADALPDNCIFLVDTYDTLQGVRHAITAARRLRERGHEIIGIRLDSGDLGSLARQARGMLDEAGFADAAIVASSSIDEEAITALRQQEAPIAVWGVGTTLSVGRPDATLDVVYKLSAIRDAEGRWHNRMKRSDTPEKMSCPGILQVDRLLRDGVPVMEVLHDIGAIGSDHGTAPRDPDTGAALALPPCDQREPLLQPLLRDGRRSGPAPALSEARERALAQFAARAGRDVPLAMDERLWQTREALLRQASGDTPPAAHP